MDSGPYVNDFDDNRFSANGGLQDYRFYGIFPYAVAGDGDKSASFSGSLWKQRQPGDRATPTRQDICFLEIQHCIAGAVGSKSRQVSDLRVEQ